MAITVGGDRCNATTISGERCKGYRLQGYKTCRKHTNENWEGRCQAKANSTQEQCKKNAVEGYNVCGSHGAGSPHKGRPGGSSPRPHGPRLKRALPPALARRYEEAYNDERLLSLRSDIALTDVRINQLAASIPDIGAVKQWDQLHKIAIKLKFAIANENKTGIHKHSRELIRAIEEGTDQRRTDADIRVEQEHKRKLTASQWKMLKDMEQMITAEEATAVMMRIATAFNNVTTLFAETLGEDKLVQLQRMFGMELRDLQNIKEPKKQKSKSGATYSTIDVVPKPKTAARARKEAKKERAKDADTTGL